MRSRQDWRGRVLIMQTPKISEQRPHKYGHGFAMIEVLVAVLLFMLGILALVGLNATMNKNVTQAKLRGEASFLANELIGRMWADTPNLAKYVVTDAVCSDTSYTNCTQWVAKVQHALPNGGATVELAGSTIDITLNWTMPGEAPSALQVSTNINP